jgi:hypothetical protein
MSHVDLLSAFPVKFPRSKNQSDRCYIKLHTHYAIHGQTPVVRASSIIFTLNEGKISVCRGMPDASLLVTADAIITPVYSLDSNGPPAVPTGLVFVRFSEQVIAKTRQSDLAQAGYEIAETVPYAPHVAWLRATDGGIAEALIRLPALEAMTDVVNFEPQMLVERRTR